MKAPGDSESDVPQAGGAAAARKVLINFVTMAVSFSINHGTVSAVIGLASSKLGPSKGSMGIGVLYFGYVLTAMFLSTAIIGKVGSKGGLMLGVSMYCLYVASFLLFTIMVEVPAAAASVHAVHANVSALAHSCGPMVCSIPPDTKCCGAPRTAGNLIVLTGSAIGGVAAGFVWSAQGAYFAQNAAEYATAAGISKEDATAKFGGIFATVYLSFEVVMKIMPWILSVFPDSFVWFFYTAAAFASAATMTLIAPMKDAQAPPPADGAAPKTGLAAGCAKVGGALALLSSDVKVALMAPTEATMGFSAPLMNIWVNVFVVGNNYGKKFVGPMMAVTVVVAAAASAFGAWYTTQPQSGVFRGKPGAMIFGDACFGLLAAILLVSSCATLSKWPVMVLLYVLQGLGRGVFESTNKGVFADFFTGEKAGAGFANFVILSGGASTLMLFLIPGFQCMNDHGQTVMSTIVLGSAALAVPTYLVALQRHRQSTSESGEVLMGKIEDP